MVQMQWPQTMQALHRCTTRRCPLCPGQDLPSCASCLQGSSASQVDVDATDSSGMTALHWSAGICLVNVVETLVKPGVNGKIRM